MAKLNDVAVLDIGSKKISVMIGNKTPKGVFNVKGFGSCYYSGFSGGKWFNVQDLKSAVGKALHVAEAESGVKAKKLYIGVPSEFIAIVVKEVVLARGRAQRITDADVTELFEQGDTYKNHSRYTTIGNFAIYYTLDDKTRRFVEPRGIEAYKITGLVSYVLCERSFTSLFENIAKDLRLKEVEYVSSIWAEGMSLLSEDKRYRRQLIADVGYITSSVAVVQGDGLVSLTSFSLGGGHVASDIAMMFEVPFSLSLIFFGHAHTLRKFLFPRRKKSRTKSIFPLLMTRRVITKPAKTENIVFPRSTSTKSQKAGLTPLRNLFPKASRSRGLNVTPIVPYISRGTASRQSAARKSICRKSLKNPLKLLLPTFLVTISRSFRRQSHCLTSLPT